MKVISTDDMTKAFREKDDKYRKWATQETREKKVGMAVMVPLIISHDGAIHKDAIKRWNDIAKDIKVNWVRMAQSVLRYNVITVMRFFNKGSWVSEAWRKEHPEEYEDEPDGVPERITTAQERREQLNLEPVPEDAVCVRSQDTPPPRGVRLTSAVRETPNLRNARTNQPT